MTAIYHITHIDNLASIVACDSLWCDTAMAALQTGAVGIAHSHIKERRARKVVPVAAGGFLSNYVPFYFAPRSPMLFAIHKGNVQGYNQGQKPVVHLVSSVSAVRGLDLICCFTDGHAEMAISNYYSDDVDLDKIDWDIMRATIWRDTNQDLDRKRRRQAEFLVHALFPWSLVSEIGVIDTSVATQVRTIVQSASRQPPVNVHRDWYY